MIDWKKRWLDKRKVYVKEHKEKYEVINIKDIIKNSGLWINGRIEDWI